LINGGWAWGNQITVNNDGNLFVKGRNILAELDDLRNNTVRVGQEIAIRGNRENWGRFVQASDAGNRGAWETLRIERI
jgi:hypothetical protein